MSNKAFVYGTLKRGFCNHRVVRDAVFITTDVLNNHQMYSLGAFPYITESEGDSYVVGEVFEVDENTIERMDMLEGYPDFYDRKVITTAAGHECWVYYFHEAQNNAVVEGGKW